MITRGFFNISPSVKIRNAPKAALLRRFPHYLFCPSCPVVKALMLGNRAFFRDFQPSESREGEQRKALLQPFSMLTNRKSHVSKILAICGSGSPSHAACAAPTALRPARNCLSSLVRNMSRGFRYLQPLNCPLAIPHSRYVRPSSHRRLPILWTI